MEPIIAFNRVNGYIHEINIGDGMRDSRTFFRALADETRLQMLTLIMKHGELCVCAFVEVLEIKAERLAKEKRVW